jgi:beta-fructofuranosidase
MRLEYEQTLDGIERIKESGAENMRRNEQSISVPVVTDHYVNIYKPQQDRMVSEDLEHWTYAGKLNVPIDGVGGDVRDPQISVIDGVYHMVMCCCDKVGLSTSEDFVTWTDMTVIFKPDNDQWRTESPFLVPYDGRYYLFWTLWDTGDLTTSGYSTKTFVQCSDSLLNFNGDPIAEFCGHAPNVIQDADRDWFISSTDYPHRGISVAPLEWKKGESSQ